jgi:hypothetical protein
MGHHKKSSQDELITGAALTVVFSILYFRVGGWFWIFPLVFAGVLPLVRGLSRLIEGRARRPLDTPRSGTKNAKAAQEREILRLAKSKRGILTVASASLDSSLSLEETEKVLSDLSSRGFAQMEVEENGTISYRFPDFLPNASIGK